MNTSPVRTFNNLMILAIVPVEVEAILTTAGDSENTPAPCTNKESGTENGTANN